METHAFGFRLRANARRAKCDFLRYNWDTDKVKAVNNIADYWPLLAEMIATGNAKTKAFESSFNGFGPLCQADMVLHENVHSVDSAANDGK